MKQTLERTKLGTGALVWAGFDGPVAPGEIVDAIRAGKIGGIELFAIRGNIRNKDQVRAMMREIQGAARAGGLPPIPAAVDQEGGQVVRVAYRAVFPSAMAIAATGDPSYAETAGRLVGEGLRADGITVNNAPVCDVNTEPRNPVIGTRSFGDDPRKVAAFAAAWVRGSEGAGVATTPKHFPGHGDAPLDSHLKWVDITADRVEDLAGRGRSVKSRPHECAGPQLGALERLLHQRFRNRPIVSTANGRPRSRRGSLSMITRRIWPLDTIGAIRRRLRRPAMRPSSASTMSLRRSSTSCTSSGRGPRSDTRSSS